jgi:hypothetical protein
MTDDYGKSERAYDRVCAAVVDEIDVYVHADKAAVSIEHGGHVRVVSFAKLFQLEDWWYEDGLRASADRLKSLAEALAMESKKAAARSIRLYREAEAIDATEAVARAEDLAMVAEVFSSGVVVS